MRFVVDTNVLISAALFEKSLPGQALYAILQVGEILLSVETLHELHEVLYRPRFDKYLTIEEREEFIFALTMRSRLINVSVEILDCRDPKDNKFLELGIEGQADYIISGDQDLLVLHPYSGINIVTPADFLSTT